jgi:hypothetical protein
MVVAQICILAPKSSMSAISDLVVESRAAPSPPHHSGSPLGEPPCSPAPLGFRPCFPVARGSRRLLAVDVDLIGWSTLPDTASAIPAADCWGPPVSLFEHRSCAPLCWIWPAQRGTASAGQISPVTFFRKFQCYFSQICEFPKFIEK